MNVLLDRSLPPRMARSLRELVRPDDRVESVRDRVHGVLPDRDWLAAADGAILIGVDPDIRNNPHRLEAWKQCGCPVLLLSPDWLGLPLWDQAWMLMCWFDRVREQPSAMASGFVYEVPAGFPGRFKKLG